MLVNILLINTVFTCLQSLFTNKCLSKQNVYKRVFVYLLVCLFISLSFSQKLITEQNNFANKTIVTLTIILCFIIFSKNMLRVKKNFDTKYIDYPWPKKNSFSNLNEKNYNIPVKNGETIEIRVSKRSPIAILKLAIEQKHKTTKLI